MHRACRARLAGDSISEPSQNNAEERTSGPQTHHVVRDLSLHRWNVLSYDYAAVIHDEDKWQLHE